jgi:hypothetical protein
MPSFVRETTGGVNGLGSANTMDTVTSVCANLLQYGLYEQGRLFGVPDVTESFVVDARPDASSHVLSVPLYNNLFFKTVDKGGTAFNHPEVRLEAYIMYRLASVTIWGMIIGSVVGFFFARSGIPLFYQAMRFFGLKDKGGRTNFFTAPSTLDVDPLLAAVLAGLAAYWTLYTDPAIQSHYPITKNCADWIIGEDHSVSGAYVTSWGKRRFSRGGEQQLGIVIIILASLPILYQGIAPFVDGRIAFYRRRKIIWTVRNSGVFWTAFVLVAIIQVFEAVQANLSGRAWWEQAEMQTMRTRCRP